MPSNLRRVPAHPTATLLFYTLLTHSSSELVVMGFVLWG